MLLTSGSKRNLAVGLQKIDKVLGAENPADILTKHVDRQTLEKALQKMGMVQKTGRSAVAPQATGVQNQLLNKRMKRRNARS